MEGFLLWHVERYIARIVIIGLDDGDKMQSSPPLPNVAYILLHFPRFTETFVAEEIQTLRSQGVDVRIISVLKAGSGPVQPLSEQLLPYTWYAPGLLSPNLWLAQMHFLFKSPHRYVDLLIKLLRQPYPDTFPIRLAKRLIIFLKAVAIAYHLRDSEVQLLHAHFAAMPGAAAGIVAKLLELPFTVTAHAFDIYCVLKNELLRLVTSQASHVVAISEYNRQHIAKLGTCRIEDISVVRCGVNLSQFEGLPVARAERQPSEPFKILSVGSLLPKKGHLYLIHACHLLQQRGFDFSCDIIGSGENEPELAERIQHWGVQDRVRLIAYRAHPEIIEAYRQYDVFVLASTIASDGDRDGIPVVLMEAGAMGMPLISTEVSGIPELVQHEQTGWVVPPGDPEALADAIELLDGDPELRARLGQNARSLVEEEFDSEKNAHRLLAVFHSKILQNSSRFERNKS
jgi:colanic acid/amylovoran biosynthesis glycosyltransferase